MSLLSIQWISLLIGLLFLSDCKTPEILIPPPSPVEWKGFSLFPFSQLSQEWTQSHSLAKPRSPKKVKGIVLHTTESKNPKEYIQLSWENQMGVHFIVTQDGKIYGEPEPANWLWTASPPLDENWIHIAVEGEPKKYANSELQKNSLVSLVQHLSQHYKIPLNNFDVASGSGVFTHSQSKKKFGAFLSLDNCGGDAILQSILESLGGKYYPELEWKDRFEGWVLRKEKPSKEIAKQRPFVKGRGLTPTPKAVLKSVEKTDTGLVIEDYRVRYLDRGKIKPSCLVLHYTAIPTFKRSLEVLEMRQLTATIMVDVDGKAYQLLDEMNDYPSTAVGTNHACIQIEIVGNDTEALLSNPVQTEKVVQLTQEISELYQFPLSNERIEEFRGVYSHTQAKKKFGGSIFLSAPDFDPGEPYMKVVIEKAGGVYFPEPEWYGRKERNWIVLWGSFQP